MEEFEYKSTDFAEDEEWAEGIRLYNWRNRLNAGHYKRVGKVIYFDNFIYNLIMVQIERRRAMGAEGKGYKFYI